jgi:pilus assembly protein CpaB
VGRRAVLLTVAALIAAAGTALVLLYVQGINARATADQQPVRVLTATVRIEPGETMEAAQAAGKVDLVEWPKAKVLPGALSSTDDLQDQVAISPVFPGEQIIPEKFGDPGEQDVLNIPKGRMAISVELTDPARVAGFVSPGSQVAIFVSGELQRLEPDGSTNPLPQITKLLLPKVDVIGVGQTTILSTTRTNAAGEETTEEIPKTILTIAVTQAEAEQVFLAAQTGALSFALRNEDTATNGTDGTILNDLYKGAYPGMDLN